MTYKTIYLSVYARFMHRACICLLAYLTTIFMVRPSAVRTMFRPR